MSIISIEIMADESLNSMQLWGESTVTNQELPPSWSKDVLLNIEQDVIINSIRPVCFKHSFCNRESKPKEHGVIVLDDIMKRTCKLLKYKNDLKEIAEKKKIEHDAFNMERLRKDIMSTNSRKKEESIHFYRHESSDFVNGIFTETPLNITNESSLQVLKSCVSTILAYTGFSVTTILPLQLLTEVAEDYIKRMVTLLHLNVEKEALEGESGFCDALDRTCHEMGIGSVRTLSQYFKEETLRRHSKIVKECNEELPIYEEAVKKLLEEKRQTSEFSFLEMDDENLVIPELHLTSISGSNMSSEPFEAGLQMLQTLERQQMMNMDLSNQPSSSTSISASLTSVKSELEDVKPIKRRRK